MDEYKCVIGKVLIWENGANVNNLERVLNENALMGYELVSLYQSRFDGLQFSLVMKRVIQ